jgi:alginate O-acetyltransferase complex protein AlgJ
MLDVHVGEDGWMFLTGGSNSVFRYFTDPAHFAPNIGRWKDLFDQRLAKADALGAVYRHLIVPDKFGIHGEKSGIAGIDPRLAPALAMRGALANDAQQARYLPMLVDLRSFLLQAKAVGVNTYFKTDAHWTFEGCYVAYLALCANLGASPDLSIPDAPRLRGDLFLDLGSKLDPPVQEEYVTSLFFRKATRVRANDMVAFKEEHQLIDAPGLHAGSNVVFRNETPDADPRRVVLFGDSYSEYRTHQLTGMLAETFSEVHFVWSANVDWRYVEAVRPAVILTEMAERFMNIVPADDLDLAAFSAQRLREFRAEQGMA